MQEIFFVVRENSNFAGASQKGDVRAYQVTDAGIVMEWKL
jgi:hypothetical protein